LKLQLRERGAVDHELIWGLIGLAAMLTAGFIPLDRVLSDAGYTCGFRRVTGYPCPTCGATRAWVLTAHGSVKDAFRISPVATAAFLCILVYVPYALGTVLLRTRRVRITGVNRRGWRKVLVLLTGLLVINWAYMIVQTHRAAGPPVRTSAQAVRRPQAPPAGGADLR